MDASTVVAAPAAQTNKPLQQQPIVSVAPRNPLAPDQLVLTAPDANPEALKAMLLVKYGLAELTSILTADASFIDFVAAAGLDVSKEDAAAQAFHRFCEAGPTLDCQRYDTFVLEPVAPSGSGVQRSLPIGVSSAGLVVVMQTTTAGAPNALLCCLATQLTATRAWNRLTASDIELLPDTISFGLYGLKVCGFSRPPPPWSTPGACGTIWWVDFDAERVALRSLNVTAALREKNITGNVVKVLATGQHAVLLTDKNEVFVAETAGSFRYAAICEFDEKLYREKHADPVAPRPQARELRKHRPTCIAIDEISPGVLLIGTDKGFVIAYELSIDNFNSLEVAVHLFEGTTDPAYDAKLYTFPSREPIQAICARQVLRGGVIVTTTQHSMTCVLYDMLADAYTPGQILLRLPISSLRDRHPYVSAAFCGTTVVLHSSEDNAVEVLDVCNRSQKSTDIKTLSVQVPDSSRSATGVYAFPRPTYQYQSVFASLGLAVVLMPDGLCLVIAPAGGLFSKSAAAFLQQKE
jgi:hypothetical protein